MKKLMILLLILMVAPAFATTIKCYSAGQLIYSGKGEDVLYGENWIGFKRDGSQIVIFGNCITEDKVKRNV